MQAGSGTTGGNVYITAGAGNVGGNVFMEAGSTSSTSAAGVVQAVGSAFQIRPAGPGSSPASAQLQLGIRTDMSQYYTISGDENKLSFVNPQGATIFSFPSSGVFTFENAVNFGNEIQIQSTSTNAVFSGTTSLASESPYFSYLFHIRSASFVNVRM